MSWNKHIRYGNPENLVKLKKVIHPVEIVRDMAYLYPIRFVTFSDHIYYSFPAYSLSTLPLRALTLLLCPVKEMPIS